MEEKLEGTKTDKAVALKYDPEQDEAPVISAIGAGKIAERIFAVAEEQGIPVYENTGLVEALSQFELGEQVPEELYEVIAQVLAWVIMLDKN